MKPMIETTIFNTKKDGRGQVIADLLAYEADMEDYCSLDTDIIHHIVDVLQEMEEENSLTHFEIKAFSGDILQVKEVDSPNSAYLWGAFCVFKVTLIQ